MSRVYIAGPLFCDSERSYNIHLKQVLSSAGHEPVLPQENPVDMDPERMSDPVYRRDTSKRIFEADIAMIESCDTLLINLDGRVPDEGACVELGYAYARGKRCIGIKTDVRVAEFGGDNMMISGILGDSLAHDEESLLELLEND